MPTPHNVATAINFKYDLSDNFLSIRTLSPADDIPTGKYNLVSYALIGNSITEASAAEAIDPTLL